MRHSLVLVSKMALMALCLVPLGCDGIGRGRLEIQERGDMGVPLPDLGPVDVGVPLPPAAVDTETGVVQVTAGTPIRVSCPLSDMNGAFVPTPEDVDVIVRVFPSDSVEANATGDDSEMVFTPTVAGEVRFICSVPQLAIVDATPAQVTVVPASPAEVITTLDQLELIAGEGMVTASCHTVDRFGNVLGPEDVIPTLQATPTGGNVDPVGLTASFEVAGVYSLACDVPGARSVPADLLVHPNLPADIVVSLVPNLEVYGAGQVVQLAYIISDRFGNVVPNAEAAVTSDPVAWQDFGDGRFRYTEDGFYTLTATVLGETQDDIPLSGSESIEVNGSGPTIICDDGVMFNVAPGADFTLQGSVADPNGVEGVTVDGQPVEVAVDGTWSYTTTAKYGMNYFDVAASDGTLENSQTCTVLLANRYVPESSQLSDAITLSLGQSAIDDGGGPGEFDSLNDLLVTALRSQQLNNLVNNLMRGRNIVSNRCRIRVCVIFCACVFRAGVRGRGASIGNSPESSLQLRDGGLTLNVRLNNPSFSAEVYGRATVVPFNIPFTARVSHINLSVDFSVGVDGGRPRVRVTSTRAEVGNVSVSGLPGFLQFFANIAIRALQGTIRGFVASAIENLVANSFNSILDGILGGLGVDTLGSTIEVPRLDGNGVIPMRFGLGFSRLEASSTRLLAGLAPVFSAPPAHARPTLGAPLPPERMEIDPPLGGNNTVVALYIGMLNQILHALWRGGMFDGTIDLGDGQSITLYSALPPVAIMRPDGKVELQLGALTTQATFPGIFTDLTLQLGAVVTTTPTLNGDDIDFGEIEIEEIYFNTPGQSLPMVARDLVEILLRDLVEIFALQALNDALPAIPIPSLPLPASVSQFGLPAGTTLGVVSPDFETSPSHFVLRGQFGRR